jgi:glyoxylate/hydroxypyruvate reductase A
MVEVFMSLLILVPEFETTSWMKHIRRQDPRIDLRVWPTVGDPAEIVMALVWNPPQGELTKFPNLRCIASMGAGVDHILRDPQLPPNVPITRVVDPSMPQSMSEYVIMAVLNHCRHTDLFRTDQEMQRWEPRAPRLAADTVIGIMGMGQLGRDAAEKLVRLGFPVRGWSRSRKEVHGVKSFAGTDELEAFLAATNVLVCMLPLTLATRGILCRRTFDGLPVGAYLINVARGAHLVEADLLQVLAEGRLAGACLDVFREEPLPREHPFWTHPDITLTPHISSLTHPRAIAPQIVENYRRLRQGRRPLHVVDRERGY